ncbi:MAG: DUF3810 domain-containing protein [Clostridia bacterium]|nr:DUF3810 domain-containing protein [Clostridia bacterium]
MNIRKILTPFNILLLLSAAALIMQICFVLIPDFADFFNSAIAHYPRVFLAKLTGIFPFSIAEIMLFSLVPLSIVAAIRLNKAEQSVKKRIIKLLRGALCIVLSIFILYVTTFSAGYHTETLDKKLDLEDHKISREELYSALIYAVEKTNDYAEKINYTDSGASKMPFDYKTLSKDISENYKEILQSHSLGDGYSSRIKPLIISPVMTYTHISGVYSFFTGEANLNTNYPDYVCVFSTAHEMAHQRGFARENEANFMAFLICSESDNDYVAYSGWLSIYTYLSSAMRQADAELYREVYSMLCDGAKGELISYSKFFDKYRYSTASKISDAVNDTYLKAQGTEGTRSYGMVVDLAVSYINTLA